MRSLRSLVIAGTAAVGLAVAGLATSAQEFRLLLIEQVGCHVCAAFNRDVAPAYLASPENLVAPLVHADLRGPLPAGVTLASRPFVTPTFILIGPDGTEMERLIGFPGQDFFWPYLDEMIDRARDALSG